MVKFIPADIDIHRSILVEFNVEYLDWIVNEIQKRYDIDITSTVEQTVTVQEYVESKIESLVSYEPQEGIFYLLQEREEIIGMGGIRKIKKDVGEIKRMYIRPEFRGRGFGKALLTQLLAKGKEFGFAAVYLDTGLFLKAAQHLYRSAGFIEREQYPETEVPQPIRHLWLYMEKKLH
jgi:N-acetylglutamate synthase-like GNAT family acetyltransferase